MGDKNTKFQAWHGISKPFKDHSISHRITSSVVNPTYTPTEWGGKKSNFPDVMWMGTCGLGENF